MKIALSCVGKEINDNLDSRFGRCSYFLIYDSEQKQVQVIDNKGQSAGGGAGISAAQQIIDNGVQAVVTGNMGPNAYNLMNSSGIKVYRCTPVSCREAIDLFEDGKLEEITAAGPSHMGMNSGR